MQILPIAVVLAVLVSGEGAIAGRSPLPLGANGAAWAALVPPVVVLLGIAAATPVLVRGLDRGRAEAVAAADRLQRFGRLVIVVAHVAACLFAGWPAAVRTLVGDPVLLDEVIAAAPPLVAAILLWRLQHPIEVRVRRAMLLRRLDAGRPVRMPPTPWRYVIAQVRLHLLLVLVPLVLVLGLGEAARRTVVRLWPVAESAGWADAASLVVGVVVLATAPVLARVVLAVHPLPAGELRDDMVDLCRRGGVRVRDILLWDTGGTVPNAAVMGLVPVARYVLLTDALVEMLPRPALRAVMAHELAHVRHRHIPWLVVTLVGVLAAATFVAALPLALPAHRLADDLLMAADLAAAVVAVVLSIATFGWVSRRFEGQADADAVRQLGAGAERIEPEAVASMAMALARIAGTAGVDPRRRSWRHGSIAWRLGNIRALEGRPARRLPIDRTVARLKLLAVVLLALGVAGTLHLDSRYAARANEQAGDGSPAPATAPAAPGPRSGPGPLAGAVPIGSPGEEGAGAR